MVDPMIPRVQIRRVALILVFALCQVIGTMCALPDLSVAAGAVLLVEEGMACPWMGPLCVLRHSPRLPNVR